MSVFYFIYIHIIYMTYIYILYIYNIYIIYIIYKPLKNWQKLSSASHTSFFSCVVPDFVWSFQNRYSDANPNARGLKSNYLERNQAYKPNMEECKPLHLKVQNIKDCWKQNKCTLKLNHKRVTVCSHHVTYVFQSESTL